MTGPDLEDEPGDHYQWLGVPPMRTWSPCGLPT